MLTWFAIGGERFGELDAHEAGTVAKKKKSLQTFFFWQHDRVLWIFL